MAETFPQFERKQNKYTNEKGHEYETNVSGNRDAGPPQLWIFSVSGAVTAAPEYSTTPEVMRTKAARAG